MRNHVSNALPLINPFPLRYLQALIPKDKWQRLACEPECGCTLAYSTPKVVFCSFNGSVSTSSTTSQPPCISFLGNLLHIYSLRHFPWLSSHFQKQNFLMQSTLYHWFVFSLSLSISSKMMSLLILDFFFAQNKKLCRYCR